MTETKQSEGFVRWFLQTFLTVHHFKNLIAMVLISVYSVKMLKGEPIDDHFFMILGLVIGAYFNDKSSAKAK